MRKAVVRLLGVLAALALLAAVALWLLQREIGRHFVRDALMTAAPAILDRLHAGETTLVAVKQVFVHHHEASVSPIWFDSAGEPVDAWGTRFRVTHDPDLPVSWVEVRSAGPDRQFETEDDLSHRSTR